jgi:hypothetical protein
MDKKRKKKRRSGKGRIGKVGDVQAGCKRPLVEVANGCLTHAG